MRLLNELALLMRPEATVRLPQHKKTGNAMNYEPWSETRASAIIAKHLGLEGPMMPILHALQHAFGYVPDEAIPLIAAALNETGAEVYGVITFYHDFRRSMPAGMC